VSLDHPQVKVGDFFSVIPAKTSLNGEVSSNGQAGIQCLQAKVAGARPSLHSSALVGAGTTNSMSPVYRSSVAHRNHRRRTMHKLKFFPGPVLLGLQADHDALITAAAASNVLQ
jgi:hypothetical protein